MLLQNRILQFLLLLAIVATCACQHKTAQEGLNVSAKVEAVQTPATIDKTSMAKEKPAVIYTSNDLGKTWATFAKGIPADATLSGIKQVDNTIYVTTDYHGVFVSNDGLDNWKAINGNSLKGLDINCIEVEGDNLVIGTLRKGILISKDGGLTWLPAKGNITSAIRAFIKSGKTIYAGTDAGIFASVDMGDTWTHVFGQLQILGFTALHEKIYAATQSGALVFNGNETAWKSIYEGDALHDIGNDGKYIYAMTIGQQLLKTQNDGASWENAQNGITYPVNYYTNEIQHVGNDIFSAQWIGIYHSVNNGESWSLLNGLPSATAFSTLAITEYGILAGISIR